MILPANGDADSIGLKQKLKDIQQTQAVNLQNIQSRFLELRKKGKLVVAARDFFKPAQCGSKVG